MDSNHFTYWLRGYFEISDSNNLSPTQVQIIRDHLDLVFKKVTPDRTGYDILDTKFTVVSTNWSCGKKPNFHELFDNPTKKPEPELYC